MDLELNKELYRNLQQKLYIIKNKLNDLETEYENLILNTKKNILINNKIIFENDFENINRKFKRIKQDTINEIIPNINNKL